MCAHPLEVWPDPRCPVITRHGVSIAAEFATQIGIAKYAATADVTFWLGPQDHVANLIHFFRMFLNVVRGEPATERQLGAIGAIP